ncbi:PTS sugar transporter subunit IIC [Olsenella sp. HMSC062G07]|uniref:PTS mannose/fructose/sorbose/N-acetylgalactosamine transporter subunit IIC n=1 Tax=Olsenella sp. HMSC062G07 TaxID=1739330 RepID=UPI0008A27D7B|nr:PTS sugar transporter subunit IIC [Olsenella sp. HMSC062G07]OFK23672.1 PTS sorbose transporter subunit IIC [Olsenella sp. HMSC062G07]
MTVLQAALLALLYWISQAKVWYGFSIMRMPLCIAPFVGLMFGDMETALKVGATLQMVYIGSIAPGGNPPADEGLASCVAIPIAITAGIEPTIAISLAIPLGLLGVVLENVRKTLNTIFVHKADEYALEGNGRGVRLCATLYPILLAFPMRFVPVFVGCLFGPDAIQTFVNMLPQWATIGLATAGNILPALGFAITMIVIGKKQYLPLFVGGFFLVAYTGLSTIGVAIFGAVIVLMVMYFLSLSDNKSSEEA